MPPFLIDSAEHLQQLLSQVLVPWQGFGGGNEPPGNICASPRHPSKILQFLAKRLTNPPTQKLEGPHFYVASPCPCPTTAHPSLPCILSLPWLKNSPTLPPNHYQKNFIIHPS